MHVSPTQLKRSNGSERLNLWLLLHNSGTRQRGHFHHIKCHARLPPPLNLPPCSTLILNGSFQTHELQGHLLQPAAPPPLSQPSRLHSSASGPWLVMLLRYELMDSGKFTPDSHCNGSVSKHLKAVVMVITTPCYRRTMCGCFP